MKYKGYVGSVEYSEEDDCLFGKVQGLQKDCITYEGNDEESLCKDFQEAVDSYLSLCRQRGVAPAKPYSGVLNLRLKPETHSQIATMAQRAGITVSSYVRRMLERDVEMAALTS